MALSKITNTGIGTVDDITLSGGIVFGTTGGTVTSKTLDDYEEGTWTVEMYDAATGGNASSTTTTGYYTKIGKLVTARFYALNNISTSGMTGGNNAYFTLPFAASSTGRSVGSITLETVNLVSRTQVNPTVSQSENRFRITETGDNLIDQSVEVQYFNGTTSDVVGFTMTYATD